MSFVLSGWIRSPFWRMNVRVVFVVAPIVFILGMEVYLKERDRDIMSERIEISDDILLRYHYRPESEGINSRGLWDDEYEIPKPQDVYRIAVLGDSVPNDPTIPQDQRFHRVMGQTLREAGIRDERVEVVNVSCEGYNTAQEVRLFEKVGLDYEPDLVLVAYVLNDPFIQNGGYRRFGNSFFLFRFLPMIAWGLAGQGSCPTFEEMNRGYSFQDVVRRSLERLRLLSELHDFEVAVATLPVVEDFSDPDCLKAYDRVGQIAREQEFDAIRVVDAFAGEDHEDYLKPEDRFDVTHPNVRGHVRIGRFLAENVAELIRPPGEAHAPVN
ncbi:MAG: SGNH/GDSL hydrolase family protein [Myxococcota bacterium]